MWERVARRARVRRLTSVEGEDEDATLTRTIVRSVMNDSRSNEPARREMTDEEADAFAQELEAELESQQQAAEPPAQASSHREMTDEEADTFAQEIEAALVSQQQASETPAQASSSGIPPEPLSDYEQERLRNIARNRQRCLKGWVSLQSRWCPCTSQARPPQKGECALLLGRREGQASRGRQGTMLSKEREKPPQSRTTRTSGSLR